MRFAHNLFSRRTAIGHESECNAYGAVPGLTGNKRKGQAFYVSEVLSGYVYRVCLSD